jgi:hypothetical protein
VRTISVPPGGTAKTTFEITCRPIPRRIEYTIQFSGDIVSDPIPTRFYPGEEFAGFAIENVRLTLPAGPLLAAAGPGGRFPNSDNCTRSDPALPEFNLPAGDPNRLNTWGGNSGTYVGVLHGFLARTEGFQLGNTHIDFQGVFVPDPANPTQTKKDLNLAANNFPSEPLIQEGPSTVLPFTRVQALTSRPVGRSAGGSLHHLHDHRDAPMISRRSTEPASRSQGFATAPRSVRSHRLQDAQKLLRLGTHSSGACAVLVMAVIVMVAACSGSSGSSGLTAPEDSPPADEPTGNLIVYVQSSGPDDPGLFTVRVDTDLSGSVEAEFPAEFLGLFAGDHIVTILMPPNCASSGPSIRTVRVPSGRTANVIFEITCTAIPVKVEYTIQLQGDINSDLLTVRFPSGQPFAAASIEGVRLTFPSGILTGSGPDGRFNGSGCTRTEPGVDPNRLNSWGRNAGTYQGRLSLFLAPGDGFVLGQAHIDFQGHLVQEGSSEPGPFTNVAVNQFPSLPPTQAGPSTVLTFRNAQALTGSLGPEPGADPCVTFTITATPR